MSDVSKVFRLLKSKKPFKRDSEAIVNFDHLDHNQGPSSAVTTKLETENLPIQDIPSDLQNTHKREDKLAIQSTFEWSDPDIPDLPDCSLCCCEDVDNVKTTVCWGPSSHHVCLDCAIRFAEEEVNIKTK